MCFVLAEIVVFGPPRATRTSLLLLLLMSPTVYETTEIWCHFETIFGVRNNLRFGRNLMQIDPRDKI